MINNILNSLAGYLNENLNPVKPIQVCVSRNDKPVEWIDGNVFDGIQDNEDFSGYISFDEKVESRVKDSEIEYSCQNTYQRTLKINVVVYGFKYDRFVLEQRMCELIDSFGILTRNDANIDTEIREIELNPQKVYMEENQTDTPPRDGFTIIRISVDLLYTWNYNLNCPTDLGCRC